MGFCVVTSDFGIFDAAHEECVAPCRVMDRGRATAKVKGFPHLLAGLK